MLYRQGEVMGMLGTFGLKVQRLAIGLAPKSLNPKS